MKLNKNTLITIGITLVFALAAYWFFFTGNGNQAPLTVTVAGNEAQQRFQSLISELQPITFDTSVFSDPRFISLTSLATPIAPETTGRSDPFAPVSRTGR